VAVVLAWIGIGLVPSSVFAENSLPGSNGIAISPSSSSGGFYSDPGSIQNNLAEGAMSGREYKYNDAQNQAANGMGAALGAGVSLAAAAAAEFAKLNFPQGAKYMGMAGLEFAQAAAS